jgi:hypothetical protein
MMNLLRLLKPLPMLKILMPLTITAAGGGDEAVAAKERE